MEFKHVQKHLKLDAGTNVWNEGWELSQAIWQKDLFCLQEDFVKGACVFLGYSLEVCEALNRARLVFLNYEELSRLVWYCHYYAFIKETPAAPGIIETWPMLPSGIDEYVDMFYALVLLSGLPSTKSVYSKRHIPEAILKDTLADIELWILEHRKNTGRWGLSEYKWLTRHIWGTLFKVGRLQYEIAVFSHDIHVFQNKKNRLVVMLAGNGIYFNAEGMVISQNDKDVTWISHFNSDHNVILGHPILANGSVQKNPISMPAGEWKEILKCGDNTLNVHIPALGPLRPNACAESYHAAIKFFNSYFSEYDFRAFVCVSWLMDAQLCEYLSADSNIVQFQRNYRLFPVPNSYNSDIFQRAFGTSVSNIDSVVPTTSLQNAVLEHIRKGKKWRIAGGVCCASR